MASCTAQKSTDLAAELVQGATDLHVAMLGTDLVAAAKEGRAPEACADMLDTLVALVSFQLVASGITPAQPRYEDVNTLQFVMEAGFPLLLLHQPAFEEACFRGLTAVAAVLLRSSRVEPNRLVCLYTDAEDAYACDGFPRYGTVLQHAIFSNNLPLVRVLLGPETAVGVKKGDAADDLWPLCGPTMYPPLVLAASLGHVGPLKALLANPVPSTNGITATPGSATTGTLATVLQHGVAQCAVTLQQVSYSALGFAAARRDPGCICELLQTDGVDVNLLAPAAEPGIQSATALSAFIAGVLLDGHIFTNDTTRADIQGSALQALLNADGIDVNKANTDGCRPLDMAYKVLRSGFDIDNGVFCIRALLQAEGIDVNLARSDGFTLLHNLATIPSYTSLRRHRGSRERNEWLDVLAMCLRSPGINVNLVNDDGNTALQHLAEDVTYRSSASYTQCDDTLAVDIARLLLSAKGADVNAVRGADRITPLHDVVCNGHNPDLVRVILVGGGCRFKVTSAPVYLAVGLPGDGTPFGMATEHETEVRKLFQSGIDYWQRKNHREHSWAMKRVIVTLLTIRLRLFIDGEAAAAEQGEPPQQRPHLPEEIWLEAAKFLRSADFV